MGWESISFYKAFKVYVCLRKQFGDGKKFLYNDIELPVNKNNLGNYLKSCTTYEIIEKISINEYKLIPLKKVIERFENELFGLFYFHGQKRISMSK